MLSVRSEREKEGRLQYVGESLLFLHTFREAMRRPAEAHNNRVLSFTVDFIGDGAVGNLHNVASAFIQSNVSV